MFSSGSDSGDSSADNGYDSDLDCLDDAVAWARQSTASGSGLTQVSVDVSSRLNDFPL